MGLGALVVSPTLVASLLALLPAMGLLFVLLRRYEHQFEDAGIFFALMVGLFAGIAVSAFEIFAIPFGDPLFVESMGFVQASTMYIAGYAFFQAGVLAMFVGLGRFKAQRSAPFYGFTFGTSMGAMMALAYLSINLQSIRAAGFSLSFGNWILLLLIVLAFIGLHGAAGAYAGSASSQGKLWKGWGQATLVLMILTFGNWLLLFYGGNPGLGWSVPLAEATGAVLLLVRVDRQILDKVFTRQEKRELQRRLSAIRRQDNQE